MRGAMKVAAAIVLGSALVGCARGGGDEWAGLAHPAVLAKAGLKYYWTNHVPLQAGESVRNLYRLDENVYCLTSLNRLIAMDAASGSLKWAFNAAYPNDKVFGPVHADGVTLTERMSGVGEILSSGRLTGAQTFDAVMLNTLSYVTVLNRANGDVYRRPRAIDFGEQGAHKFVANTRGATDGVHYFVGSPDGEYEALRLQEGVLIWTMSTAASLDPINAPLVFANGRLYLTNEDGMVICTSVLGNRGRQEWSQRLAGAVREGIHVDQRGCFVPCRDHRIYAFDPLTGGLLWEPFICRGPLDKAIQVGESSIFQYAEQDAFYVLDVATGRLRWTNKDGRLVLALHGGTVYLKDARNNLLILDEMMGPGKPATRIALVGHELFTGNAAAPAIYTAKADGRVFCITPVGVERLTPEMLQEGKAKTKKPPASGPAPTSAPVLAPG